MKQIKKIVIGYLFVFFFTAGILFTGFLRDSSFENTSKVNSNPKSSIAIEINK